MTCKKPAICLALAKRVTVVLVSVNLAGVEGFFMQKRKRL